MLRRASGEIQIGTDPRHAVVVTGVPDRVAALLATLDGRTGADDLMARAGPDSAHALRTALTGLFDLGLLDDAAPPGDPPVPWPSRLAGDHATWTLRWGPAPAPVAGLRDRSTVLVHGSGRVAVGVATLLAGAGVGWVHVAAEGVVKPEDTGCGYVDADIGRPRSDAAVRAIRRITTETRTSVLPPDRVPDLVVIADVTVVEPRLTGGLAASGVPHLLAHSAEAIGTVGPLVVPGRTPCLRCAELRSADDDECWPVLATQLAGRLRLADLASAQATAAFAAGQVLRFLHGPSHAAPELPVWGGAVEVDPYLGRAKRIELPAHPRCACGAARTRAYPGRKPIP